MKKSLKEKEAMRILASLQKDLKESDVRVDLYWISEPLRDGDGVPIGWRWKTFFFHKGRFWLSLTDKSNCFRSRDDEYRKNKEEFSISNLLELSFDEYDYLDHSDGKSSSCIKDIKRGKSSFEKARAISRYIRTEIKNKK